MTPSAFCTIVPIPSVVEAWESQLAQLVFPTVHVIVLMGTCMVEGELRTCSM